MDNSESESNTAPGLGKAVVPGSGGASGISSGVQPGGTTPSSGMVGRAGTIGAPATSGVSGAETNDSQPGGGTVAADMVNERLPRRSPAVATLRF